MTTHNTPPPYKARVGSLAHSVIRYLQENEDEELTRPDIAVKFNVPASSVGGCLLHAKQQGGLVTITNRQGQQVYRLPEPLDQESPA
jgi:hypothetical protein